MTMQSGNNNQGTSSGSQNNNPQNNAGGTQGNGQAQGNGQGNGQAQEINWDDWIKSQPEQVQTAFSSYESGLRTSLQEERTGRKNLEKQLREISKGLEDGSKAKDQLTQAADKLSAEQSKNSFYEAALTKGITNLKLAWIAATDAGLINSAGTCDFESLKSLHPQLFSKIAAPPPPAGAGAGTQSGGNQGGAAPTMNGFIRSQTGRG